MTTLVLCALAALAVPVAATRAGEPADGRPSLRRSSARDAPRPHTTALLAARLRKQEPAQASSSAVAGGLAGVALASEVIPYANTALLLFLLQRLTGARSMVDVLDLMVSVFGTLGWASYPVYAALLVGLQVVPLISGLLIIILAGALYGPLWGTVLVSLSLSLAAVICAVISRTICTRMGYGLANLSTQAASVDAAIAAGPTRTSLLLVLLLRLSPVMPFTFSNYLFGLTSTRVWVLFLGTLLGTLPTQTVYVSAGALGRQALQGGLHMPPAVYALGTVATLAAIVLIGHVAKQTLSGMKLTEKDLA